MPSSVLLLYVDVELIKRYLHIISYQRVRYPLHKVGFDVVVVFGERPHFEGENKAAGGLFAQNDGGRGVFKALSVVAHALHYDVLGAFIVLGVSNAEVKVYSARLFGVEVGQLVRGEVGVGYAHGFIGGGDDVSIHYGDVFHHTGGTFAGNFIAYLKGAGDENYYARRQIGQTALQSKTYGDAQGRNRGGYGRSFKAEVADIDAYGDKFDYSAQPRHKDDAQRSVHVPLFKALVQLADKQVGEFADDEQHYAADDHFQAFRGQPLPNGVQYLAEIDIR